MDILKTLIEARAATWEKAQAHLETVQKEGREFTGEADATWVELNKDLDSYDARIAEMSDLADRNAKADEARAKFQPAAPADKAEVETDADRLRAMVASGRNGAVNEFRALTVGTAAAGGDTVPDSFASRLVEYLTESAAIRQTKVNVIQTESGNKLYLPRVTGKSTAAIVGENTAIPASEPTFDQAELDAYKYAFTLQASRELEQDTGVNLLEFLARQGGEALGEATGAHYITGTGTGQPRGVVTAATTGATGANGVAGVFTADNLLDLYFSVISKYRRNAEWLISDAGMKVARKLKDGNSQYLWAPGMVAGEQSTLFGRPVTVERNVADPAATAKSVVFGDLSTYTIRDVLSIQLDRSEHFAFDKDVSTWRFLLRTDADQIDTTGSIKVFAGGAAV